MRIRITFKTVIFILIVLLIFYLKFKAGGVNHWVGPESVIELFK